MKTDNAPRCIIRRRELTDRVGLSISTIDRLERQGEFPRRRRLGHRAVGWIASEVEAWLAGRKVGA